MKFRFNLKFGNLLALGLIIPNWMNAQQVALSSQYDLISSIQNPAYNGLNRTMRIDALSRVQWSNFPGTPTYTALAFQTPLDREFAVGAQFQSLSVGKFRSASPLNLSSYTADIAYHTQLGKNIFLSTGIRTGIMSFNMRLSQLISEVPTDISVAGNDYNFNSMLVGGGMMLYGKNFYLGASIPQVALISDRLVNNVNLGYNARPFYLVNAGFIQKIKWDFSAKLSTQFRNYDGLPWQYDANIYVLYKDIISFGYGYRNTGSNSFMAQFKVNEYFQLVYMYEQGFVYDKKTAFYSQEFGLRYDLNFNKQRVKVSPRYY
ncbi:MAG: PorP/SprF family type IX secretion system membrane protein [Saprospiraceae bacterium]|jgi:type IX secretion system PorP/SprF family membrane protein|nr:PorP/SprF family type IX secretion system membrane protein [Saprospiraceae bacterium]